MEARIWAYEHVMERLSAHEDVFLIRGERLFLFLQRDFLSEEECLVLIGLIDSDRRSSTVMGECPDKSYRTSESSPLGSRGHEVVAGIDRRLCAYLDLPRALGEPIEGIRYGVGAQFKPHNDYFHEDQAYWPAEVAQGGQRTWTALMALNEPEAGGGTVFLNAGVRIKPRRGNLLLWCNLDSRGGCNPMSLHCGEPVERGLKFVATKWFRERRFRALADVECPLEIGRAIPTDVAA